MDGSPASGKAATGTDGKQKCPPGVFCAWRPQYDTENGETWNHPGHPNWDQDSKVAWCANIQNTFAQNVATNNMKRARQDVASYECSALRPFLCRIDQPWVPSVAPGSDQDVAADA